MANESARAVTFSREPMREWKDCLDNSMKGRLLAAYGTIVFMMWEDQEDGTIPLACLKDEDRKYIQSRYEAIKKANLFPGAADPADEADSKQPKSDEKDSSDEKKKDKESDDDGEDKNSAESSAEDTESKAESVKSSDDEAKSKSSKAKTEEMLRLALSEGMTTLVQDGIEKVLKGQTTYKEVKAVAIK